MNRKTFRWQAEFESMESIVLLSAVTLAGRPGAAAVAELEAKRHSILLFGTAEGTYSTRGGPGAVETFSAHGLITPLGNVTLKGSIRRTSLKGSGSVTISTKHGKVFAKLGAHGLGSPVIYRARPAVRGNGPTHREPERPSSPMFCRTVAYLPSHSRPTRPSSSRR